MIKATKIALLYWLQQALRAFCPHDTTNNESLRVNRHTCPNCAVVYRANAALSPLCGWMAYRDLPKCNCCREILSKQEIKNHGGLCQACDGRQRQEHRECRLCFKPLPAPANAAGVHSDCADAENYASV